MQTITLYKITRPDGGVTIGPNAPEPGTAYETLTRLVADSGKTLTDGTNTADVVDTYTPEAWTETEGDDITADEALAIITGGATE